VYIHLTILSASKPGKRNVNQTRSIGKENRIIIIEHKRFFMGEFSFGVKTMKIGIVKIATNIQKLQLSNENTERKKRIG
jgi:hypothetical protein